jgi:hypothetical protein
VYEKPTAPASIGGVLDDGLRLWKASLPKVWVLAILAQATIAIPSIIFRGPAVDASLPLNQRMLLLLGQGTRSVFLLLGFLMVSYIFRNAMLLRIDAIRHGGEIAFGAALTKGLKLLPRAVLLFLLIILIFGGVGFVAALLSGVIAGITRMSAGNGMASLVAVYVSFVLVFAVILYFSIRIFLAFVIFVVADRAALKSINESWRLTRGNFWSTSAIVSVIGIVFLVLALVVYLVVLGAAVGLGPTSTATQIITQVASVVVYSFLGSLWPAVNLTIYEDRKLRKEGGDLAGRVSALASQ